MVLTAYERPDLSFKISIVASPLILVTSLPLVDTLRLARRGPRCADTAIASGRLRGDNRAQGGSPPQGRDHLDVGAQRQMMHRCPADDHGARKGRLMQEAPLARTALKYGFEHPRHSVLARSVSRFLRAVGFRYRSSRRLFGVAA